MLKISDPTELTPPPPGASVVSVFEQLGQQTACAVPPRHCTSQSRRQLPHICMWHQLGRLEAVAPAGEPIKSDAAARGARDSGHAAPSPLRFSPRTHIVGKAIRLHSINLMDQSIGARRPALAKWGRCCTCAGRSTNYLRVVGGQTVYLQLTAKRQTVRTGCTPDPNWFVFEACLCKTPEAGLFVFQPQCKFRAHKF